MCKTAERIYHTRTGLDLGLIYKANRVQEEFWFFFTYRLMYKLNLEGIPELLSVVVKSGQRS